MYQIVGLHDVTMTIVFTTYRMYGCTNKVYMYGFHTVTCKL